MGVDYTGNYGIGIQIYKKEFDADHEWFEDFEGCLDELIGEKDYYYFEVGSHMYGGDENELYLCIDEPFKNGYCGLEEKVSVLLSFLAENEIEYEGTVDVVGGLNIW